MNASSSRAAVDRARRSGRSGFQELCARDQRGEKISAEDEAFAHSMMGRIRRSCSHREPAGRGQHVHPGRPEGGKRMPRILIVEDEPKIAFVLESDLRLQASPNSSLAYCLPWKKTPLRS